MADIITELGYGCTADIAHCKDILSLFEPLNDLGISKLLGAVVSTTPGLGEACIQRSFRHSATAKQQSQVNQQHGISMFLWIQPIKFVSSCYLRLPGLHFNDLTYFLLQLWAPRTNWTSLMEYLDHEGFNISDERAFRLLMSIYDRTCMVYTGFPVWGTE